MDLEQIKAIYYSPKKPLNEDEPLHTLADVASKLGVDYYTLCSFLVGKDIDLHVFSAVFANQARIKAGQYLLDYYIVTKYALDVIAVVFDYDNKGNVQRAMKKSPYYTNRPVTGHKKKDVKKIVYQYQPPVNKAFNDYFFNRTVWAAMQDNTLSVGDGKMTRGKPISLVFFEPIYKKLVYFLAQRKWTLDAFLDMVFLVYLT